MTPDEVILVVDDHLDLLENISLALEAGGYSVRTATDGMEALDVLRQERIDLILADISMPRMNGYQLFQRVRENMDWIRIPYLFLSARALDSDIRYGKELGAEDYLTKPIQPEDLLAAVRGKITRARQLAGAGAGSSEPQSNGSEPMVVGELRVDPAQHQAWLGEQRLQLSAREFTLLETLAARPGQVLSPPELVRATHELETDPVEAGSLVRPLIRSLRRKLGYEVGELGCIENIRGVGYRLVKPE